LQPEIRAIQEEVMIKARAKMRERNARMGIKPFRLQAPTDLPDMLSDEVAAKVGGKGQTRWCD
jgi:hypothetical protein